MDQDVATDGARILQNDIGAGYRARRADIDAAAARVLASGWYILGAEVEAFEREFAAWLGVPHAVGVANGTDALALALRALDIGPGCSVVTVSHTAVATVAAIEMVGATPVLVDIDPLRYCMCPDDLEATLARCREGGGVPPIRAVIPVHIYGQPADMVRILDLSRSAGLRVIEDCSQAHGATIAGRRVGSFGDVAAFSLYPTKNLGALGDGGIVATADPGLSARIAALRQYGWRERYVSAEPGVNSRLDELQAAILRVKLRDLDAGNARRAAIAARYDSALPQGGGARAPWRAPGTGHVFHQYVLRSPRRDAVRAELARRGIDTAIHYPVPVHLQPAYAGRLKLGPSGCAASAAAAQEILSLPMFPELAPHQIDRICGALATL